MRPRRRIRERGGGGRGGPPPPPACPTAGAWPRMVVIACLLQDLCSSSSSGREKVRERCGLEATHGTEFPKTSFSFPFQCFVVAFGWKLQLAIHPSVHVARPFPILKPRPFFSLTYDLDGHEVRRVRRGADLALVEPVVLDQHRVEAEAPLAARRVVIHLDASARRVDERVDGQQLRVAVSQPGDLEKEL